MCRMADALLPCPFCGNADLDPPLNGRGGWYVRCSNPHCTTSGPCLPTDARAIRAWNSRPAALALLEALQALLPMFAQWHEDFPDDVGHKEAPALAAARAAIAKATGSAS